MSECVRGVGIMVVTEENKEYSDMVSLGYFVCYKSHRGVVWY